MFVRGYSQTLWCVCARKRVRACVQCGDGGKALIRAGRMKGRPSAERAWKGGWC